MSNKVSFGVLGLEFISLVDDGLFLDIDAVTSKIEASQLFQFLKLNYSLPYTLSYSNSELKQVEAYFRTTISAIGIDTLCVKKNGLCLLVALCIEGLGNPVDLDSFQQ